MLALLSTLFTSIISGGATGILGVAVQRFFDLKNKSIDSDLSKEKMAHEISLKRIDVEIMEKEWAGRTQTAQLEFEGREAVADAQAFAASFVEPPRYSDPAKLSAAQGWLFIILDFIRGLIRPGLTLYLCGVTTLVYVQARSLLQSTIEPTQALELVKLIIGTLLYLTTTCVLWWFGTRNKKPQPKGEI